MTPLSLMFLLHSCCVDVLGAEQAAAQALVHFGPACLSPPARPLPVAFVFGQRSVALELCAKAFEAQNPDPTAPVVLLSEPACAHALGEGFCLCMQGGRVNYEVLYSCISVHSHRVPDIAWTPALAFFFLLYFFAFGFGSHLDFWEIGELLPCQAPTPHHLLFPEALATLLRPRYLDLLVSSPALPLPVGSLNSEPEPLERFGRCFPLAQGRCLEEYGAFYVGGPGASCDPDLDPDLSRLLLGWAPERPFFSCCPDTGRTRDEGARAGRLRARRRYLVERARDAHVVGLLVGTLGVARHREALAHLRNLTRAAGKRSYVLALGRPTPPKLANFPEVDVFVLLACPLGALTPQPSGSFFRPVLSPCELEAACNPAWPPPGLAPHLTHYADLLPGE